MAAGTVGQMVGGRKIFSRRMKVGLGGGGLDATAIFEAKSAQYFLAVSDSTENHGLVMELEQLLLANHFQALHRRYDVCFVPGKKVSTCDDLMRVLHEEAHLKLSGFCGGGEC